MSTALQSIQEKIKAELAEARKTIPPVTGRNISTKGKLFTFPDGKTHPGPIQAVILDHRNVNRYYVKPYDPQNPAPPHCFAISKVIEGMRPHEEAMEPQAETCSECVMNQWGSAPNGRGKACRNTVRLAIVPPDADVNDDPMILTVSPTGLKSWASLVNGLESFGKLPIHVVTEIAFNPDAAYSTLVFKALGPHDRLEEFWQLREKAQSLLDRPFSAD